MGTYDLKRAPLKRGAGSSIKREALREIQIIARDEAAVQSNRLKFAGDGGRRRPSIFSLDECCHSLLFFPFGEKPNF